MEQPTWDKARTYAALAHPLRIRILELLEKRSMGFADLRRSLDIRGPGTLQHHLQKLQGLVQLNSDGNYALTSLGMEALSTVREEPEQAPWWTCTCMELGRPRTPMARFWNAVIGVFLLGFALYLAFPEQLKAVAAQIAPAISVIAVAGAGIFLLYAAVRGVPLTRGKLWKRT